MFPNKESETGIDVVTCKMADNDATCKKCDVSFFLFFFVLDWFLSIRHLSFHPYPFMLTMKYLPFPFNTIAYIPGHLLFRVRPVQCNPSCVCQKIVWTLEFSPQLRTNTKTTKICEIWADNKLIKEDCLYNCASIANQVYAAQGTDPDICAQIEREHSKLFEGDYKRVKPNLLFMEQSEQKVHNLRHSESTTSSINKNMPSFAPPEIFFRRMTETLK